MRMVLDWSTGSSPAGEDAEPGASAFAERGLAGESLRIRLEEGCAHPGPLELFQWVWQLDS